MKRGKPTVCLQHYAMFYITSKNSWIAMVDTMRIETWKPWGNILFACKENFEQSWSGIKKLVTYKHNTLKYLAAILSLPISQNKCTACSKQDMASA